MEQRGECWQLRSVYAAAVLIHFLMAACSMAKVPVQSMNKLLECFELNLKLDLHPNCVLYDESPLNIILYF